MDAAARRLHITHLELEQMIKVSQERRAHDKALRSEFNLSAASIDAQLALVQYRSILDQMKLVVQASDEKLAHVMSNSDMPTALEKRIFSQIIGSQRAS